MPHNQSTAAEDVIHLVQTCGGCPEAYEAFHQGKEVGYLNLRGGSFTVNAGGRCGDQIHSQRVGGDGLFDDDERDGCLRAAVRAIQGNLGRERTDKVAISGDYTVEIVRY